MSLNQQRDVQQPSAVCAEAEAMGSNSETVVASGSNINNPAGSENIHTTADKSFVDTLVVIMQQLSLLAEGQAEVKRDLSVIQSEVKRVLSAIQNELQNQLPENQTELQNQLRATFTELDQRLNTQTQEIKEQAGRTEQNLIAQIEQVRQQCQENNSKLKANDIRAAKFSFGNDKETVKVALQSISESSEENVFNKGLKEVREQLGEEFSLWKENIDRSLNLSQEDLETVRSMTFRPRQDPITVEKKMTKQRQFQIFNPDKKNVHPVVFIRSFRGLFPRQNGKSLVLILKSRLPTSIRNQLLYINDKDIDSFMTTFDHIDITEEDNKRAREMSYQRRLIEANPSCNSNGNDSNGSSNNNHNQLHSLRRLRNGQNANNNYYHNRNFSNGAARGYFRNNRNFNRYNPMHGNTGQFYQHQQNNNNNYRIQARQYRLNSPQQPIITEVAEETNTNRTNNQSN
ncbi:probable serine/threonine-protein kinase DDB_G0267686 [Schistocerca gregaria]|uniref:probable serine/threonine-protein kinase DDB_G0267686 n=1 Tax=Schistocerca gregaria TaxID=7010 RepID=UPI00211E37DA|nr:probable serine/threonine-protein kinase DDB_G0267686 [Schistocerca gregaria]